MMTFLRKHRNWLMIVIAILAIPFIFYFNKTDFSARGSDRLWRLYDHNVSQTEAQHIGRLYDLAQLLGMYSFLQDLTRGTQPDNRNETISLFIINLIVLRHEAERLGVQPSNSEIADRVRNMRVFTGANGFDQTKYDEFTQKALSPYGMSEAQIEDVVRDELSLNRIKALIATGVSMPESESKAEYEKAYGKLSVSVIRLKPEEFLKDVKVTDEDVSKYYETHKTGLKTDEKRKIEFVSLILTGEQKKLTGKERIDILQKLANRAEEFSQALTDKGADFHQIAAKFQLPVQSTGEFTQSVPDPKLKDAAQVSTAAFRLTEKEPNSDVIEANEGYYLLHLAAVVPSRPLTLEEAKPKIVETIQNTRAREQLATKGAKISHDLREGLKVGEALPSILQKLGAKSDKVEPFSLEEDPAEPAEKQKNPPPDMMAIKSAVANMQPGDVSEFFPSEQGGFVALLEKRESPDPAKYETKKAAFTRRMLESKQEIVFMEWLRERQTEAGLYKSQT